MFVYNVCGEGSYDKMTRVCENVKLLSLDDFKKFVIGIAVTTSNKNVSNKIKTIPESNFRAIDDRTGGKNSNMNVRCRCSLIYDIIDNLFKKI